MERNTVRNLILAIEDTLIYKTPVQKIFFAQMNMPHHHPALRETSNFHFLEVTPLFYEVQDFL